MLVRVLLVIFCSCILARAGHGSFDIDVKAEYEGIQPGQPCILLFTFTNNTNADMPLDLGQDRSGAFAFRILNAQKKEVARGDRKLIRGGVSRSGKFSLPANGNFYEKVLLNQWCSTMLDEGDYTVSCYFFAQGVEPIEKEFSIRILPLNPEKITGIFKQMESVLVKNHYFFSRDVNDAIKSLGYSGSPFALPFLMRILEQGVVHDQQKKDVILGIERIGSIDAVNALVGIAEKAPGSPMLSDRLCEEVILSIYRLKDRGSSFQIKAICEKITTKRPRPKERQICD